MGPLWFKDKSDDTHLEYVLWFEQPRRCSLVRIQLRARSDERASVMAILGQVVRTKEHLPGCSNQRTDSGC